MNSAKTTRRLTAILAADAVGYSRLMGDDDEATVEAITMARALFTRQVEAQHGRVVNAPGDSILAEFASVVEAVKAAVDIQAELASSNKALPEHRRMQFRIGVNLGDVVVRDGALYGDGVNIAARLEALADAGGICI